MKLIEEKPVMVFKKDDKYSIGISNKKKDGTYEKGYYPIQFNKGVELENQTKIYIKNAWLSFYKWEYEDKKGTTWFIKCNDFELVSETIEKAKEETKKDPYEEFGNQVELENLELPF